MTRDPEELAAAMRRQRSRLNAIRGDQAQEAVGMALRHLGLRMVERIETGWKVERRQGRIIGAVPIARVHADWTAVMPGGRSVRCEAKKREDDQLSLADFERHQIKALDDHHVLGGLSLVGWRTSGGIEILAWPIAGLVLGRPLHAGDERTVAARWPGVG
jgi:hypothetical protein